MLEKAGIMLDAIRRRAGAAPVEHAFVCERDCAAKANSSLGSFVELPDELWNPPTCKKIFNDSGHPCSRYAISSIKFVYGIIHEALRLDAAGRTQPRWWLIKDDDTFVHVPNFLLAMAEGSQNDREWGTPGAPLWEQPIAAASLMPGCGGTPCGGGGFVLSGALGLELAKQHGARWLGMQMMAMPRRQFYFYDRHVQEVVSWAKGARFKDMRELEPGPPVNDVCKTGRKGYPPWKGPCWNLSYCKCARSEHPATWHLVKMYIPQFRKVLGKLDAAG